MRKLCRLADDERILDLFLEWGDICTRSMVVLSDLLQHRRLRFLRLTLPTDRLINNPETLACLCEALRANSKFDFLCLGSLGEREHIDIDIALALGRGLQHNTSVRGFLFEAMGVREARILAAFLRDNTELQVWVVNCTRDSELGLFPGEDHTVRAIAVPCVVRAFV